ncbi:hypothetical protein BDD12DRAFT_697108, partial [Trichophaea hybrida]
VLLKHHAKRKFYGGECGSTLAAAARVGHELALKALLPLSGNFIDRRGGPKFETALYFAIDASHNAIITLLLEEGANLHTACGEWGSPFFAAVGTGQEEMVRFLLGHE